MNSTVTRPGHTWGAGRPPQLPCFRCPPGCNRTALATHACHPCNACARQFMHQNHPNKHPFQNRCLCDVVESEGAGAPHVAPHHEQARCSRTHGQPQHCRPAVVSTLQSGMLLSLSLFTTASPRMQS